MATYTANLEKYFANSNTIQNEIINELKKVKYE